MNRRLTTFELGLVIALAVLGLDQLSKAWILYGFELPVRGSVQLLPIFNLSMVWNKGVSFGLLAADSLIGRILLVSFSLLVAGFLVNWLKTAERLVLGVGISLVLGGAIGNAIDRAVYGAVVDFLDFSGLGFPWVFNIADSAISLGVAILVYDSFFAKEDPESSPGGADEETNE